MIWISERISVAEYGRFLLNKIGVYAKYVLHIYCINLHEYYILIVDALYCSDSKASPHKAAQ